MNVFNYIRGTIVFGVIALPLLAGAANSQSQDRIPFSVTYRYRIDLNVSTAIPSLDMAIQEVQDDTLAAIELLVVPDNDALFLITDWDSSIQDSCEGSGDFCGLAISTITVSLRPDVDDLLIEYAALVEIQRLIHSFNSNHADVFVSFAGPYVVGGDVAVLLQGANSRMAAGERATFEHAFTQVFEPVMLNNEPSIRLTSASVFLQQVMEQSQRRRRLQTSDSDSLLVRVRVTGQCNDCSSSEFERLMGEAVNTHRQELEQELVQTAQVVGTDFFEGISIGIAPSDESPGISECCLEFFTPLSPVPVWVWIVAGSFAFVMVSALCLATCCNCAQKSMEEEHARDRKRTRQQSSRSTLSPSADASSTTSTVVRQNHSRTGRTHQQNRRPRQGAPSRQGDRPWATAY